MSGPVMTERSGYEFPQPGRSASDLTKRELFAAMAMQGLCTSPDSTAGQIAGWAVQQADALIEALAEPKP